MTYLDITERFLELPRQYYPPIPTDYDDLVQTVDQLRDIYNRTLPTRGIHNKLEQFRNDITAQLNLVTTNPEFYVTIFTFMQFYHDQKLVIRFDVHSETMCGIYTKRIWQHQLHRLNPNNITGCIFPASITSRGYTDIQIGQQRYTMSGPLSFMNQACVDCADADFRPTQRPTDYQHCSLITADFRRFTFQPSQQIFAFYNNENMHYYQCPHCRVYL
jgi:hypothetical protein